MKNNLITIFITCLLTSCLSVARLSDFSQTSDSIDFDKLSKEYKLEDTPYWTYKTSNEYYFEKDVKISEAKLIEAINNSLKFYKYSLIMSNVENKCIIAKRGIVPNEWKSIAAIYYRLKPNKVQVYIRIKITQDITGGWGENRGMEVGKLIEYNIFNKNIN